MHVTQLILFGLCVSVFRSSGDWGLVSGPLANNRQFMRIKVQGVQTLCYWIVAKYPGQFGQLCV